MEERNQGLKSAQKQINSQSASSLNPENKNSTTNQRTVEELKLMADLMEDMQRNLEPLRDKALDEKARLTGYSQCAEAMIKVIADRAITYKRQAVELSKQQQYEKKEEQQKTSKKRGRPQKS